MVQWLAHHHHASATTILIVVCLMVDTQAIWSKWYEIDVEKSLVSRTFHDGMLKGTSQQIWYYRYDINIQLSIFYLMICSVKLAA